MFGVVSDWPSQCASDGYQMSLHLLDSYISLLPSWLLYSTNYTIREIN